MRRFLLAAGLGAGVGALAVGALVGGALTGLIAALFALAGVAEWFGLPRAAARRPPGTARSAGLCEREVSATKTPRPGMYTATASTSPDSRASSTRRG